MVEAVLGSVAVDSRARGWARGGSGLASVSVREDRDSSKETCWCWRLGLEAAPVKLWVEDLRLSW